MKVSIDSVKYSDMPSRQWYMSPSHTSWYYHTSRKTPVEELSPQFLEATLDPSLRLLALGLNSLGYTTLPSCSGHYKKEEELNEAYDNLLADAKQVRNGGLELVDVENGSKIIHKSSSWYLPWDRQEFSKIASGYDGKPEGYLGFNVPMRDGYKVGAAVDSSVRSTKGTRYEVKRTPSGYTFELRVYTGKPRSQDEAWRDLGACVLEKLVAV